MTSKTIDPDEMAMNAEDVRVEAVETTVAVIDEETTETEIDAEAEKTAAQDGDRTRDDPDGQVEEEVAMAVQATVEAGARHHTLHTRALRRHTGGREDRGQVSTTLVCARRPRLRCRLILR